jgi:superkiller protein 3
MKKKNVKIGFRRYRTPLIIGSIVTIAVISPFIVFNLITSFYLDKGDRFLNEGKIDEAIDAYETVLFFNGNSDRAYLKIARALQKEKSYPEALEAYDRAFIANPSLKLPPERATDLIALGDELGKGGNWVAAIEAYKKAIAVAPNSGEARFRSGKAFYTLQRWEEAAAAFQKAIELNPARVEAYFYLGETHRERKLWENAEAAYRGALKLNSDDAKTFQRLGESLQEQGKWAEAADIYLQAIARDPKNGEIYNQLGRSLARQGKVNEAIVIFQQALQIEPKNARISENLCYTRVAIGEVDEGLEWCRRAVQLDPNLADARFFLEEVQRGRLIHDNPELLKMPERIPSRQADPLVSLKRSIVKIVVRDRAKGSMGTGWIVKIDKDRAWIVTNRHVVADSKQEPETRARIFVEFYSDPPPGQIRKRSRAKILHVAPPNDWLDLAVLEIKDPPADIRPLQLSPVASIPLQPVKSIGNPFNGKNWTVSKGVVNEITEQTLNLGMSVVSGQSGSPVLNDRQQVVGVISQSSLFCTTAPGQDPLTASVKMGCGLALPIDPVRERLQEWKVLP